MKDTLHRALVLINRCTPLFAFLIVVAVSISPVSLLFFRFTHNYNEGWNIYNAIALGAHRELYPPGYHFVSNNYPILSFLIASALHRVTGEYLFTGRTIAQLGTVLVAVFSGVALKELGGTKRAAILTSLFCFGVFEADTATHYADAYYTNADDPQMLALAGFTAGFYLYLKSRHYRPQLYLVLSALTFVVAINIKHNSLALLAAVGVDLAIRSRTRLLVFTTCFACGLYGTYLVTVHLGGSHFLANLLTGRVFIPGKSTTQFLKLFLPIRDLFLLGLASLFFTSRSRDRLIVPVAAAVAIGLGLYFGSAQGVSINCLFEVFICLSLALGLLWSVPSRDDIRLLLIFALTLLPFVLLLRPAKRNGYLSISKVWRQAHEAQSRFDSEVSFLAQRPGPALCEDLLKCALANKPYIYDPFNATRLVRLHLLDDSSLLNSIRLKEFSSIEVHDPAEEEFKHHTERFPPEILLEVLAAYEVGLQHGRETIYVPKD